MSEKELLSTKVRLEWQQCMEALMAAIPRQSRATMQVAYDKAFTTGIRWRTALLARFNEEVSATMRAADAPTEQQQGG